MFLFDEGFIRIAKREADTTGFRSDKISRQAERKLEISSKIFPATNKVALSPSDLERDPT